MQRQERLVFVDPEDDSVPYWWPAIIVLEEEYELFRMTMDSDIKSISNSEQLVCYFEDASFSVVPKTALVPFNPDIEPYTMYARASRKFTMDTGIQKATAYYRTGTIPSAFKWLAAMEAGVRRKRSLVTSEIDAVGGLDDHDHIDDDDSQGDDEDIIISDPEPKVRKSSLTATKPKSSGTTGLPGRPKKVIVPPPPPSPSRTTTGSKSMAGPKKLVKKWNPKQEQFVLLAGLLPPQPLLTLGNNKKSI